MLKNLMMITINNSRTGIDNANRTIMCLTIDEYFLKKQSQLTIIILIIGP